MAGTSSSGIAAILSVPVLVFGTVFSLMLFGGQEALADCNPAPGSETGVSIDPETVPNTTIAGYNHDQLVNAAHVVQAGKDLQLGVRDQTIGVMTAMGESSLNILDRGDAAGPDSRGLFQQRDNGAWGSYEDRMDPYISSTNYFKALIKIEARDSLEPTIVANRVQRNADPYHYAQFWDTAVEVVEYLAGTYTGFPLRHRLGSRRLRRPDLGRAGRHRQPGLPRPQRRMDRRGRPRRRRGHLVRPHVLQRHPRRGRRQSRSRTNDRPGGQLRNEHCLPSAL